MNTSFRSAAYWDGRYRAGGTSGAGSYGRLAEYKAGFINDVAGLNGFRHVADFGCGDGNLLSMLSLPAYTGLDVSEAALARCAGRFPQHAFLPFDRACEVQGADLCLSIDVIYHLVEDDVFTAYMDGLFRAAGRIVLIYASNCDLSWPSPHVRHRRFTAHLEATQPDWRLCGHLPNPYPYDPKRPDETSFADFFVYLRRSSSERFTLPANSMRV